MKQVKCSASYLAIFLFTTTTAQPHPQVFSVNSALRWLDWIFWGWYLPSLSINYVAMSKDMKKRLPQLYYIKIKISYDLDFIAIGVAMAKQWKTMPVNRSLVNWKSGEGGELVILEALFKSFSCFQYAWNLLGIFIDDWSQDCQVYKKNLSCCSFQWNQTTWTWGCVSKAYNFLKILANCVDSMPFRCFYVS